MEQTRTELLANLKKIRNEIVAINKLQEQGYELNKKRMTRKAFLSTDNFHDITHLLYYTCVTAGFLTTTLTSLLAIFAGGNGWGWIVFPAVTGFIVYKKRGKRSRLRSIVEKILIACIFFASPSMIPWMISIPVILCLSFFIVKVWLKKSEQDTIKANIETAEKNNDIDRLNDTIRQKLEAIGKQIDLHRQKAKEIGGTWFPVDYYFLDAVEFFIKAIANHRADNVKEMVNLYEELQYRERTKEQLKNIQAISEESVKEQKMLAFQMAFANIMQSKQLDDLNETIKNNSSNTYYNFFY
ncbi:MAG: hypothetical protein NC416_03230 [Eubacterium sp.]|nr:hypothetical protein [Eubacterium sp.]